MNDREIKFDKCFTWNKMSINIAFFIIKTCIILQQLVSLYRYNIRKRKKKGKGSKTTPEAVSKKWKLGRATLLNSLSIEEPRKDGESKGSKRMENL